MVDFTTQLESIGAIAPIKTKMRLVCIETGEDMGEVVKTQIRTSGRHKGAVQGITTDRVMEVRYHPRNFVAFFVLSRQRFESKFIPGTFKVESG